MANEPDQTRLRAYLAIREGPCPDCGFNLRGCAANRCPECGRPLRVPVRPNPTELAWHIGRAAMGATYGGLACTAALTLLRNPVVTVVLGSFLFTAPDRWRRWHRTRRAFASLPRHRRQELAARWIAAAMIAGVICYGVLRAELFPDMRR